MDRLSWDYGTVADAMRRYASAEDIREWFRRMVFNILVRNTDDHPRNHGFLFDGSGLGLSPAYDIVPSIARPGVGTDFSLAMSIGEQGREATIENALSRAARFGLSEDEARNEVENLARIVQGWKDHFSSAGCPDLEIRGLEAFFREGGSRCASFLIAIGDNSFERGPSATTSWIFCRRQEIGP